MTNKTQVPNQHQTFFPCHTSGHAHQLGKKRLARQTT